MGRILGLAHARYWARPDRWVEAGRRLLASLEGGRWASARAESRPATGMLSAAHAEDLDEADRRTRASGFTAGGPANLGLLYDLVLDVTDPSSDPRATGRIVETGVAAGWSSLAILLALGRTRGRLWSTDLLYPYLSDGAAWVGVAVPDRLRAAWTLVEGADRDVLPGVLAESAPIDLAHYDSDKSYDGARWAYELLWDALRPGGVLVADDVGDHLAFRDFSRRVGVSGSVIRDGKKFQGVLVRP